MTTAEPRTRRGPPAGSSGRHRNPRAAHRGQHHSRQHPQKPHRSEAGCPRADRPKQGAARCPGKLGNRHRPGRRPEPARSPEPRPARDSRPRQQSGAERGQTTTGIGQRGMGAHGRKGTPADECDGEQRRRCRWPPCSIGSRTTGTPPRRAAVQRPCRRDGAQTRPRPRPRPGRHREPARRLLGPSRRAMGQVSQAHTSPRARRPTAAAFTRMILASRDDLRARCVHLVDPSIGGCTLIRFPSRLPNVLFVRNDDTERGRAMHLDRTGPHGETRRRRPSICVASRRSRLAAAAGGVRRHRPGHGRRRRKGRRQRARRAGGAADDQPVARDVVGSLRRPGRKGLQRTVAHRVARSVECRQWCRRRRQGASRHRCGAGRRGPAWP